MKHQLRSRFLAPLACVAVALAGCSDDGNEVATQDVGAEENLALGDAGTMDATVTDGATANGSMADGSRVDTAVANISSTPMTNDISTDLSAVASYPNLNVEEVRAEADRYSRQDISSKVKYTNPRSNMERGWAQLDRNDDGRLSIAEYSIYELEWVNPSMKGSKDDEKKPYVSTQAINAAVPSFRKLDKDGNMFLSRQEFSSGMTG